MTKDELFYFVEQILNFESPNFAKFQSQSTTRNYSGILKQYGIVI
jgi:hypothetical protein